jgi:hypothetical protein
MLCSVLSLVWSILAVELTLVWNGATAIYSLTSVGRFIPFTIGVLRLAQVLYAIFKPLVLRPSHLYCINYDDILICQLCSLRNVHPRPLSRLLVGLCYQT